MTVSYLSSVSCDDFNRWEGSVDGEIPFVTTEPKTLSLRPFNFFIFHQRYHSHKSAPNDVISVVLSDDQKSTDDVIAQLIVQLSTWPKMRVYVGNRFHWNSIQKSISTLKISTGT